MVIRRKLATHDFASQSNGRVDALFGETLQRSVLRRSNFTNRPIFFGRRRSLSLGKGSTASAIRRRVSRLPASASLRPPHSSTEPHAPPTIASLPRSAAERRRYCPPLPFRVDLKLPKLDPQANFQSTVIKIAKIIDSHDCQIRIDGQRIHIHGMTGIAMVRVFVPRHPRRSTW